MKWKLFIILAICCMVMIPCHGAKLFRISSISDGLAAEQSNQARTDQVRAYEADNDARRWKMHVEGTPFPDGVLPSSWVEQFEWRSIGPAVISGRIIVFSVYEADPRIYWVGTAGGGLLKTSNRGATFEHQLQHEGAAAIGDVMVAPSNPNIVWAGTGEQNAIRSGTYGDGVYKSIDGGSTWRHMGLHESFQIGRIAIHPTNPDIVYVGAQGRLWGTNPERGLYKTTDGGETWRRTLYISELAGVNDIKMDPTNPDVIYASSYERLRDEYDGGRIPHPGGPGSALWKSTDAGETWIRLEGGLPQGNMGRSGIAIYPGDTNIIYSVIRTISEPDEVAVWRSNDGGETWEKRNNTIGGDDYFYSKIYVESDNPDHIWVLGSSLMFSDDGGQSIQRGMHGTAHVDHHAMWFDANDKNHILLGNDGGIYETWDRAETWDHLNHNSISTFYDVGVDTRQLYRVYGGLQDNGSWGAPNRTRSGSGLVNEDWINVGGGDGFVCVADPHDPDIIFTESQGGSMQRINLRTGESVRLRPQAPEEGPRNRFNWKTPMILSHHNSKIFYTAGSYVFKSINHGDNLRPISPFLTRTERGAATALAESPMNPDVLYVGCEDGELWVTTNGGNDWENIREKVGLAGPRWVSALEASRFAEGRAYVAFDGHRNSYDFPLVYVTEDFGQTWRSIGDDLPWGTSRTVREDVENENLLYVGAEFGVYASLDRGESWTKLNNNLPTVSVRELRVHPTAGELIAGTHGRGIWIVDIKALRQMSAEKIAERAALYETNTLVIWNHEQRRGTDGPRGFYGENPPGGVQIYYSLATPANDVSLRILNGAGEELSALEPSNQAGLHVARWNPRLVRATGEVVPRPTMLNENEEGFLSGDSDRQATQTQRGRGGQRGGRGARAGGRGGQRGGGSPAVSAGMYYAVLIVDGETFRQPIRIENERPGN